MNDSPRILPPVPADAVRQLCVLPVLWPDLLAWMDRRGLYAFRIPVGDDDLPTYGIGVKRFCPPTPAEPAAPEHTTESDDGGN